MTESFDGGIDADFFGASDTGCVRSNNEDRFISERIGDTDYVVAAAIDGLGGYAGGEYAAEIASRVIIDNLYMSLPGANPGEALLQAFINANNTIVEHRNADVRVAQMGCVAVGAVFSMAARKLYMVNCGDSRLYRYADGVLTKLSHDHSPVGRLEDAGEISEFEAMIHPRRNVIDCHLGMETMTTDSDRYLETAVFDLEEGSAKYLFCSDGLSDMLTSDQMAAILAMDCPAEETVATLIAKAKEAGGRDNVTAVVVAINAAEKVEEENIPVAEPTPVEEAKPRRKMRLPRIPRKALLIVAWVVFIVALTAIVVLGIKKYTDETYPENGEELVQDSSTVFVMVDNELDSVKVDTISRVVMQARDSLRVEIPR